MEAREKQHVMIFQAYTTSWVEKNADEFLGLLHDEINVIECFGAEYKGKRECERWFRHWNEPKENQVISWTVLNHYYDNQKDFSVFEWLFTYKYKEENHSFNGTSIFQTEGNKILLLKEFEAKAETYRPFA